MKQISIDCLRRLIKKYSIQVPRYTSYPTAVEFTNEFSEADWRCRLGDGEVDSLAFYMHIPFCQELCYYCACTKIISRDKSVIEPYLNLLYREIDLYRDLVNPNISLNQLHWGGGTPNYLSCDQMISLHGKFKSAFSKCSSTTEQSVEVDPRTLGRDQIKTLADIGFSRISFGVQDFSPDVQEIINRKQSYEQTVETCDVARQCGFTGLNIDLIYGLPNQTLSGFSQTLDKVLNIRPDRIALYGYAHVTWIKKVQKTLERAHIPDVQERIELFLEAYRKLVDAGYVYIGLDHFALPEDALAKSLASSQLHRNFMGYTDRKAPNIIGLGVSAISTFPTAFAQNSKSISEYSALLEKGKLPIEKGCQRTEEDRFRAAIIESVLCQGEVSLSVLPDCWAQPFQDLLNDKAEILGEFESDGLIELGNFNLRLTDTGRLFARVVASTFDAYMQVHFSSGRKVFSQAV